MARDASQRSSDDKVRLAVLFGGRSTEHSISCVTAGSVLAALDRERYDVVPIGITREGRWVLTAGDPADLQIRAGVLPEVGASDASVVLVADPTAPELVMFEPDVVPRVLGDVDVVLPLLHGPYGEDGTIQGLLELAGIPYVGAGVLSSAAAMDKQYMKLVLHGSGLPDIPHVVVRPREWDDDPSAVRESVASLGFPVFVKPARGGSSIGISKVHDAGELDEAITLARRSDPKVIVEAMIEGREIEVGVLEGVDGGPPEVSVAAEITMRGKREFYDFDAKYFDLDTDITVPAVLAPDSRNPGPPLRGRGVRGVVVRGAGPHRLLRHTVAAGAGERGQHDARLHADVSIPARLGRERNRLPGAPRSADPERTAAPDRFALIPRSIVAAVPRLSSSGRDSSKIDTPFHGRHRVERLRFLRGAAHAFVDGRACGWFGMAACGWFRMAPDSSFSVGARAARPALRIDHGRMAAGPDHRRVRPGGQAVAAAGRPGRMGGRDRRRSDRRRRLLHRPPSASGAVAGNPRRPAEGFASFSAGA